MTSLPHDFWHIFPKNGTFALVQKGIFAPQKMYICTKFDFFLSFIAYKFVHETL